MPVSATTRLLALLGDPVAHSLSPAFQNAAIAALGLDAVYVALRCDAQHAAPLLRGIARAGGAGNVTIPHKALAAECIERPTAALRRTGACNTFWVESGVLCGDNTDVEGFRLAASQLIDDRHGSRALIIGAGGAAAAAAYALLQDGASGVTLLNRSPDRARTLASRLDPGASVMEVVTTYTALHGRDYDLVVNASAVGLTDDDPLPIDLAILGRAGAALDLVYGRGAITPWVRHARGLRVPAADGTEMLLGQGAAAFARWFGVEAPLEAMRGALAGG
jgi:shikimate dehydrogenase